MRYAFQLKYKCGERKNIAPFHSERKTLDKIISANRNPNLDIIVEVPNHIRNSLKYTKDANGAEDYIHLEESSQTNSTELLSDFIAERLHSMIMLRK